MDPNETLKELRNAMGRLADYQAGGFPRPNVDDAIDDAVETFESLDQWLRKGGLKPEAWS